MHWLKKTIPGFKWRSVFLSAERIDITKEAITRINAAFDQNAPIAPLDLSPGIEVPLAPEQQP